MARRTGLRGSAVWGAAVVLTVGACSGSGDNARTAPVEASGDGTLRIGLILDNTGPQAFLNAAQLAAAKLAVQEINAAGGHKGRPVELLPETTEGDTGAQARKLVDAKADVVIGPTDSSRAPAAIDVLSKARITLISPANTAPELSSYKSGGYYFRTAAADIAQAPVLVKLAKDAGAKSLAVVYEDGSYGQAVSAAVSASAKAGGLDPVTVSGFKAGEAQKSAAAARDVAPDAVVVIARDGAQGAIAELTNAGLPGNKLILGDGAFRQYGSDLGSKSLEGTRALVPGVFPSAHFQAELVAVDAGLKDTTFAAETYDAVNLAALAAAAAEDDAGASIAGTLISVSGGSSGSRASASPSASLSGEPAVCSTYKDCLAAIRDGKAIDYDGESGPVRFDANGDVTAAKYMVFTYGADNKAKLTGSEAAGRSAG
ncbi:neutral amino acid transport system substrate-binding protein [Arthrobacter globiformis]|uniref:ABC transporter substrate-binding protein n=1 Tax=Arthrobacter globiformis TaxID=1665 RepID=UPI00278253DA|nr:ABC transporter substrate-binding protein [Arthrobacter globiformis]MDQ1057160.1 neutral amino acid transport system substrate-binding protein [Arthrobacter globiformis]